MSLENLLYNSDNILDYESFLVGFGNSYAYDETSSQNIETYQTALIKNEINNAQIENENTANGLSTTSENEILTYISDNNLNGHDAIAYILSGMSDTLSPSVAISENINFGPHVAIESILNQSGVDGNAEINASNSAQYVYTVLAAENVSYQHIYTIVNADNLSTLI